MKQLKCEICGGADLIKQEGTFACQTCGVKYSVEETREMLSEEEVHDEDDEEYERKLLMNIAIECYVALVLDGMPLLKNFSVDKARYYLDIHVQELENEISEKVDEIQLIYKELKEIEESELNAENIVAKYLDSTKFCSKIVSEMMDSGEDDGANLVLAYALFMEKTISLYFNDTMKKIVEGVNKRLLHQLENMTSFDGLSQKEIDALKIEYEITDGSDEYQEIIDPEIMHYTAARMTSYSYGINGKQVWVLEKLTRSTRNSSRFDIDPLEIPELQSLLKPIKDKFDTDDVFFIVPAAFAVDKMSEIFISMGGFLAVTEIGVYKLRDAYCVDFTGHDNEVIEYCATLNIKNKLPLYVYKNDAINNGWLSSNEKELKSDIRDCSAAFLANYDFTNIRQYAEKYISCYHPDLFYTELHFMSMEDATGEKWLKENKQREDMILYDLFIALEKSGARFLLEEDKEIFKAECATFFASFLFGIDRELHNVFSERGEGPCLIGGMGNPMAFYLPKLTKISEDLINICFENPERFVKNY